MAIRSAGFCPPPRVSTLDVTWRVQALETPAAFRYCRSCRRERRFVSSGKFRVNAQGRRLDAWLIYRCATCQETWNLPLWERLPVARIEPRDYQALLANDPRLARRLAFDRGRLAAAGARPQTEVACRILGEAVDLGRTASWRIRFVLENPCGARLDKLLSRQLGVSRKRVTRWARSGRLSLASGRPVKPSLRIRAGLMVVLRMPE